MRRSVISLTLATALGTGASHAQEAVPSVLAGHAVIPAMTMVAPPVDAPRDAWISGKFTGAARNDAPMSAPSFTGPPMGSRPTGLALPFVGQPFQGLSGLAANRAADGSFFVLTDNGFGGKRNSGDALLMFHRLSPDFEAGTVERRETVFLSDPDRVVPFRIINEATTERYLTGGDFDPESIQVIGDEVWIGDEFGPFLIRATLQGRVTGVFETLVDGKPVRSPDHPALQIPAVAGKDYQVPRTGGFEGMALHPTSGNLWALLEKPLFGADGEPEGTFLRMMEFDPKAAAWTGTTIRYPLGEGAVAIGDVNFIDDTRALVLERDNGEGDPSLACADPEKPAPDCFLAPARVKRVVLIDTAKLDADGTVARSAFVDLMNIGDPDGKARLETAAATPLDKRFTFPFQTIENVLAVDAEHILVINDNNLPFSSGRQLDAAAANEFILLSVPALLGKPNG